MTSPAAPGVPLRPASLRRRALVACFLALLALGSVLLGLRLTPSTFEADVPLVPPRSVVVEGVLLADVQPLPRGVSVPPEGLLPTTAPVRVSDTGSVVVVAGLGDDLVEGDVVSLHRLEEELPEASSYDVSGAVLDGSWLRPVPWDPVPSSETGLVRARLLGTLSVSLLCFLVPFLLLAAAVASLLRFRALAADSLPLDPVEGPLVWQRLQAAPVDGVYQAATLLGIGVVGLLSLSAVIVLQDGLDLRVIFGVSVLATLLGLLAVRGRDRVLRWVQVRRALRLLPPPGLHPAWLLTLPEGRRSRAALRRRLSPAEVETALQLAREGAEVTFDDLCLAVRAL